MRYVALAAAIFSLTLCLGLELTSQRKIEQRNATIAERKRELQPVAKFAAEVQDYQKKKDDLQRRIDMINQLKQNQKGPSAAMRSVLELDTEPIDSIAIDAKTLTINGHGEITPNGEVLEKRTAAGRIMLKVKI